MTARNFTFCGLDPAIREIRLVYPSSIHSHDSGRSHSCYYLELRHFPLNNAPDFVALSYQWGQLDSTACVVVTGSTGETIGTLPITTNLSYALRELLISQHLPIWIDALCVDQENDAEKSWQVGLMEDIYQSAASVFLWLGPDENESASDLQLLHEVGRKICQQVDIVTWQLQYWNAEFWGKQQGTNFPESQQLLQSIQSLAIRFDHIKAKVRTLIDRPTFSRIWLVQEVVLPSLRYSACGEVTPMDRITFASGAARSSWHYISAAVTLARLGHVRLTSSLGDAKTPFTTPWLNAKSFLMMTAALWTCKFPMIALLHYTSGFTYQKKSFLASDPRDRIYALLGITSDRQELGIVPDYSKSCVQVYRETAAALLRACGSGLLLYNHFPKVLSSLPSWVPDWSANYRMVINHFTVKTFDHGIDMFLCNVEPPYLPTPADIVIPHRASLLDGGSILRVSGILIDRMKSTAPHHEWHIALAQVKRVFLQQTSFSTNGADVEQQDWHSILLLYRSINNLLALAESLYAEHEQFTVRRPPASRDMMLRTLAADKTFVDGYRWHRPNTDYTSAAMFHSTMSSLPLLDRSVSFTTACSMKQLLENVDLQKVRDYLHMVLIQTSNRKVFITHTGRLGLGPGHMLPDDVVAVIGGLDAMVVLRQLLSGKWAYIGEAYIHGLMDGEVCAEHIGEVEITHFEIE